MKKNPTIAMVEDKNLSKTTNIKTEKQRRLFDSAIVLFEDAKAKRKDIDSQIARRNELYLGKDTVEKDNKGNEVKSKCNRNMCFELIEAQINNGLPQPKITPLSPSKVTLANNLEKYLRSEMDRLEAERINDRVERGVLKQGTHYYIVGWDESIRIGNKQGAIYIKDKSIEDVWPQPGVKQFSDVDYVFVEDRVSSRKLRQITGFNDIPQDPEHYGLVDTITYWYYDDEGYVCRLVWVKNTEYILFDDQDYESRRIRVCKECGEITDDEKCPVCNSEEFEYRVERMETLPDNIVKGDPASSKEPLIIAQKGSRIPFYALKRFPIITRVNISSDNSMYGISDIDQLENNQVTLNNVTTKIEQNILKGGSVVVIPNKANFKIDNETLKVCRVSDPRLADGIKVHNLQASIQQDDILADRAYQYGRASLGITDSYQGKRDPTAESGKAKEIAAAQSAGRMESKRRMKDAAYADLYQMMFQIFLAYDDSREKVTTTDTDGSILSTKISRYDFLDGTPGHVYYDDSFLFSVDTASVLYTSREALWRETTNNFQLGTMGNPALPETQLLYWSVMNELDYPLAAKCLSHITQQLNAQITAIQQAQEQQDQAQQMQAANEQRTQESEQTTQSQVQGQAQPEQQTADQEAMQNILAKFGMSAQ